VAVGLGSLSISTDAQMMKTPGDVTPSPVDRDASPSFMNSFHNRVSEQWLDLDASKHSDLSEGLDDSKHSSRSSSKAPSENGGDSRNGSFSKEHHGSFSKRSASSSNGQHCIATNGRCITNGHNVAGSYGGPNGHETNGDAHGTNGSANGSDGHGLVNGRMIIKPKYHVSELDGGNGNGTVRSKSRPSYQSKAISRKFADDELLERTQELKARKHQMGVSVRREASVEPSQQTSMQLFDFSADQQGEALGADAMYIGEHLLASGSDLEDDALMRQEAMLQTLYESRMASLQRCVSFMLVFYTMAKLVQDFWPRVSFGMLGYDMSRTQSIMRVATTASPVSGAGVRARMIALGQEQAREWAAKKMQVTIRLFVAMQKNVASKLGQSPDSTFRNTRVENGNELHTNENRPVTNESRNASRPVSRAASRGASRAVSRGASRRPSRDEAAAMSGSLSPRSLMPRLAAGLANAERCSPRSLGARGRGNSEAPASARFTIFTNLKEAVLGLGAPHPAPAPAPTLPLGAASCRFGGRAESAACDAASKTDRTGPLERLRPPRRMSEPKGATEHDLLA